MASTRNVSAQGLDYTTGTASIAYLNLGIPLNKNAGMCLGFRPYARTYYSLIDTLPFSPIGTTARSYNGSGSLNYAYAGAAVKYKGLSVGFNIGYMFGTQQSASQVVPIDTAAIDRAYVGQYTTFTRIGGIYWKGGVMYETSKP